MRSNLIGKAVRAVWNMKKSLPLAICLMKDTRVDRLNKFVFLFVSVGYLVFPYDFIFDFPIFGQFDDLAVLVFMLDWFIKRTPKSVLEEYGWREEEDDKKKKEKKHGRKTAKEQPKDKKKRKLGKKQKKQPKKQSKSIEKRKTLWQRRINKNRG